MTAVLLWSLDRLSGVVLMSHADQLIEVATELAMDAKDNVADLQRKLSEQGCERTVRLEPIDGHV